MLEVRRSVMLFGLILMFAVGAPAQAFSSDPNAGLSDADRNVFFFGGRFHSESFYDSPLVWQIPYEDSYFLGAGYQEFFFRSDWSFSLGFEVGVGGRLDLHGPDSLEVWSGLVFRHDGFVLFDSFRMSPALTVGFSAVTDTVGSETIRHAEIGYDGKLLVYLGPEIAVTPLDNPNVEGFFRVQHRSGAFGLIVDKLNGSNSVNLGVRFKF